LNKHRLVVYERVIHEDLKSEDPRYKLFYQLTRITRDKGALIFDDRVDALAIAVGYWARVLGQDRAKAEEDHREQLLRKDLEDFARAFHRHGKTHPKFFKV
jgi:hypothetical protein